MEYKRSVCQINSVYKAIIIFSGCCIAQFDQRKPAEDRLLDDLFAEGRYNKLSRPAVNYSEVVHFSLGVHVTQVLNMDEKNQIMTTSVRIEQTWNDFRLSWSPRHYGGVSLLILPVDMIWHPKLSLENSAEADYDVKGEQHVILFSYGLIMWTPKAILKTSCRIDVRYFPFDEQKCVIIFTIGDYDGRLVMLHPVYDKVQIPDSWDGEYWIQGEWDLIDSPVEQKTSKEKCCPEFYTFLIHTLILRRKPLFYIINLIAPSVLLSILTILVFALPPDSGEKVTLSISVFLAMMIFKLMVADIVPPTSADIALIDQYLMFNATLVVMTTIFTVLVLNIHHRLAVTHDMPAWVRKIFLEFVPRFLCINKARSKAWKRRPSDLSAFSKVFQRARRTAMREKSEVSTEFGENHTSGHIASLRKEMMNMAESTKFISEHLKKEDADNKLTEEWRYVAVVIDRLLLWSYVIIYFIGTCAIILNAPLARGVGMDTRYIDDAENDQQEDYE
ncbi:neuronal acetylcholine receptor subunit beta-4-like [Ptychodera flava]|uniref:neuronal acetylcholine receptor subunit beta-4-like n=1 Tax=Ptychodera flava TaxID=63121 RepID=UPI00396A9956